jgi:hypothetical protein
VVEVLVIISLSILVALQVSLSLGSSSVKGEFVRLILPSDQQYFSMSVIPRELVLGSILETTFAAMTRAHTREPFIYNNKRALNGCFDDLMIYLTERIGKKKKMNGGERR